MPLTPLLLRPLLVAAALSLLAACGQKGPLFMDTLPPETTLPATVTADATSQVEIAADETLERAEESTQDAAPAETTLEMREQLQGEQPAE